MYKRCPCGRFFSPLTEKQKYCRPDCEAKKKNYYKKKPLIKKICRQCGETFFTRRKSQLFCHDDCRKSYHGIEKIMHNKICKYCKKPFTTSKSYQEYCTTECYKTAKRKRDLDNIQRIRGVKDGTKHSNISIASKN